MQNSLIIHQGCVGLPPAEAMVRPGTKVMGFNRSRFTVTSLNEGNCRAVAEADVVVLLQAHGSYVVSEIAPRVRTLLNTRRVTLAPAVRP